MNHDYFLNLAAKQAAQINPHLTNPNPRVGCVVVHKNKVIAQGAHEHLGQAHAEVNTLHQVDPNLVPQCEVYITLEPCVSFTGKKTPSCTDLLLKLKPAKVVVGALDPHFSGQGLQALNAAGINTELVANKAHQNLNPWFKTWITQQRPYITIKIAQSLDGKITHSNTAHQSGIRAITGLQTQAVVHALRSQNSAILTTTATVLDDDPRLDVRIKKHIAGEYFNPDVIVMGNRGLPATLALHQVTKRKIHTLQNRDFNTLISLCHKHHLVSVMTECGSTMNQALLEADLVDEIQIFTAPNFMGEKAAPSFLQPQTLATFSLTNQQTLGNDFQLTYLRN